MDVYWESSTFTLGCNRDNPISREDSFMPTKNLFFDYSQNDHFQGELHP